MVKWCVMSLLIVSSVVSLNAAPSVITHMSGKSVSPKNSVRPPYIECQDSSECGVGNCCVLGMGRFSVPSCQSVQEAFGVCRPYGHIPFNTTVSYPDGATVSLTDVYRLFCPCAPGLSCDSESNSCMDEAKIEESYIYNTVIV